MRHEPGAFAVAWRVARKEMTLFFAAPIAWLFLASFAAVTLFVFFWGEAFFARNVADVRPLFKWMPVLLILLCSTLSMRMWSEERRAGTLEHVLTQPAPLWSFVLGKFVACLLLLVIAMLITVPLPLSVSFMGEIDWGPVLAGYLATLLLGAAYLAIGLFVSARSENQIVSLIVSVSVAGAFYLVGAPAITDFAGQQAGDLLRQLGTGARFESITRGVIDVRDLYYYVSLTGVFLALNVLTLERERWSTARRTDRHRRWLAITTLAVLNLLVANLWIGQLERLRVDTTAGQQYTLSAATRTHLEQLREPLTIRGYFSARTHPLLAPLVPRMRDLLEEYEVAGQGQVRVEFVDPANNPELEEQANQQYGIEPVPFQVADRYQSSIVSSYFDVLVQYGDEYEVLDFQDLIDVKAGGETAIDVRLRNPEYDITRAIRRVLTDFQSAGNVFDTLTRPVELVIYSSPEASLPADIAEYRRIVESVAASEQARSNGRFSVRVVDPETDTDALARLTGDYGFRPYSASLFSNAQFWFHLLLEADDQIVQLPIDEMSEAAFETKLDAGLKRFSRGFTKRIAFVGPAPEPMAGMNPQLAQGGAHYFGLQDYLQSEQEIIEEDLSDGRVSADADLLLVVAPDSLDDKAVFAIDQFLMQGGTVILATSPYSASLSNTRLAIAEHRSGLEQWLAHHGLTLDKSLVMDPQNAAFPVPVTREVGGLQLQELRMLDYPYFIDIRRDGLAESNPIVADLGQLTMAWASPVTIDAAGQGERSTDVLVQSSAASWPSTSTDIMPRLTDDGRSAWSADGEPARQVLAVSSTGRFDSWYADRPSPLADAVDEDGQATDDAGEADGEAGAADRGSDPAANAQQESDASDAISVDTVIERSPESARLIVLASNDFLRDQVIQMSGAAQGSAYLAPYQLVANAVDHALDDTGLAAIRSRGQFNRTLIPMSNGTQRFFEYLNYALAALAIFVLALLHRYAKRRRQQRQLAALAA